MRFDDKKIIEALNSLPELDPPDGLSYRAVKQAKKIREGERGSGKKENSLNSRRFKIALTTVGAAAACVLLVAAFLVVSILNTGGNGNTPDMRAGIEKGDKDTNSGLLKDEFGYGNTSDSPPPDETMFSVNNDDEGEKDLENVNKDIFLRVYDVRALMSQKEDIISNFKALGEVVEEGDITVITLEDAGAPGVPGALTMFYGVKEGEEDSVFAESGMMRIYITYDDNIE